MTADTATAASASAATGGVPQDVLEERMIDEEYKIWKKNTPFLYDYVMTHSLEWPSLTCQWLPHTKIRNSSGNNSLVEEHSLLIGTHTTGEQNYLMMATCCLPQSPHNNSTTTDDNKKVAAPEYDEEKNEFGGFTGTSDAAVGKITIKMKIPHQGEVNRARYMPQNHWMVASRGPSAEIFVWDLKKQPSFPEANATAIVPKPQAVLTGHAKEGYGMVWSTFQEGHLCTASEDSTVRLWDVSSMSNTNNSNNTTTTTTNANNNNTAGNQIQPYLTLQHHTDTVEDVDWHYKDPNLIVSVGGDKKICLWDKTSNTNQPHFCVNDAHAADINSVAFNPHNPYILATGSSDRTIGIWDVRSLKTKMHSLQGTHVDDVFGVQWAPHDEAILASCSADRRTCVWDLSRVGTEQSPEDAQDGPPELLFVHGGHTSKVSDLAWNPNAPWTMATTSEDNIFQVWTMMEEIYSTGIMEDEEDEEMEENEKSSSKSNKRGGLGPNELE